MAQTRHQSVIMSIAEYLKCVFRRNHRFKPSARKPGMETCTFCRLQRRATGKAF